MTQELHVVTGAFGFSGRYIAARLLKQDQRVRTLTNSPQRANPFEGQVEVHPLDFDVAQLSESLHGAQVLYNTYWVRFNRAGYVQSVAVQNTLKLFQAAQEAGVRRVVHVSITNPSPDSRLEYFSSKARMEQALIESGLSYAILRPTVIFGEEDVLINNIAWMLRRLPVFGVFGAGEYGIQPIHVDDFARLAVQQGQESANVVIDAIGPETFTYRELVRAIGVSIGKPRPIISVPPWLGYLVAALVGKLVGDVTLTRAEIEGLMQGLLCTSSPPAGTTKLTTWAREHADALGKNYASEIARHRDRLETYDKL
jgi:uncharacterized protein YbjT (DUF2867 family)